MVVGLCQPVSGGNGIYAVLPFTWIQMVRISAIGRDLGSSASDAPGAMQGSPNIAILIELGMSLLVQRVAEPSVARQQLGRSLAGADVNISKYLAYPGCPVDWALNTIPSSRSAQVFKPAMAMRRLQMKTRSRSFNTVFRLIPE